MSAGWRVLRYMPETGRNAHAVRSDGEPPRRLAREYGPFEDRETAELVAQRAIEKHRSALVVVLPPKEDRR